MAMMVKVDDKNLITTMDDTAMSFSYSSVMSQNKISMVASVGTLYRERWWFTIITLNYKIIKELR